MTMSPKNDSAQSKETTMSEEQPGAMPGEQPGELPKAQTKLHDQLMRNKVEATPKGQSLTFDLDSLPEVFAPSLDNLVVTVPLPAPVTEEELLERFYEICYDLAPAVARQPGETIEANDRVIIDVIGFVAGKVMPFSAKQDLELIVGVDTFLQGFTALLEGQTVGESVVLQVTIPEDYPAAQFHGQNAAFAIDIKYAEALTLPDPDNPEQISTLGYGSDLEAIMASIVEEIYVERTSELLELGDNMVLEALVQGVFVDVPEELIDEEIRRRWLLTEGQFMAQRSFSVQEQQEALDAMLQEAGLRAETYQRLKIALCLRSIAERDNLTIKADEVDAYLDEIVEVLGLDGHELRQSLKEDEASRNEIVSQYIYLRAVDHVLSHATIHFEGAEDV